MPQKKRSTARPQKKKAARPKEIQIDIPADVGDSLQGGLDAIGKVFGGLVNSIKDAVGPELMRGMEAANWLEQVASCLDEIADGLRESGAAPWESLGQLDFYVEQFDGELEGTKLAERQRELRKHLEAAYAAAKQGDSNDAAAQADNVSRASGYFRAAARTLIPMTGSNDQPS